MTAEAFTALDGTRLSYHDLGNRDATPIVLCHGLGASSRQFLADAAYFTGLGYRVLMPDIRGHGASPAPLGYPTERFSIAALASDMAALLDHAKVGPVHWVGNSLGGIITFHLVADQPGRFRSLTTFGTAHRLNLPGFAAGAIPLLYRLLGNRLTAWSTALGTTADKPARLLVASMLAEYDPQVGRVLAENVRAYDLTEQALGYSGPVLLIRGGRDIAVNQALAATLGRFSGRANFTQVNLPKGGHMANLDATDAWREALLGFWRRVDA